MPTSKELKDLDSQLKKTVISAESFKRGSSLDLSKSLLSVHKNIGSLAGHTRKLVIRVNEIEKKVNNNSRKITSLKNISKTQSERISGTNIGAKLPGSSTSKVEDNISAIAKSVNSIAEIMAGKKKLADNTAAYDRKKAEQEKRGLAESKLEKVFSGIAKTAEKVIAPVKSLLDRIFDFIGTVILGRIVFKIIEWMGDKKNQSKVKSIIRFFKDWGPTLLSLYIVFGTSFGKFARGLISLVIKSTVRLGAAVAGLAVKAGIGKAGGKLSKVAGFLGGRKGKLLSAGLEAGVTVAGTMALSNTLKGGEQPKAQGLVGGGYVRPRFPAFSGGGFNFKGMMGGAGMGAMFGPLGMLLGGAMGGSSGFVSGEKGVDKIPAMLSDGEFVMSRGAVAKYGVDTLEAMNSAGGGTNKPKIVSGTTYAAGGGLFGKDPGEGGMSTNTPFVKDPLGAINRFIKFKFGADVDKQSTWGVPTIPQRGSQPRVSSGSLLTDPVGAVARIANNMGIRTSNVPISTPSKQPSSGSGSNIFTRVMDAVHSKTSGSGKPEVKTGEKGFFQELQEKLSGSGAATYRDAGAIYARQMLGGFGGPVSERDLSKESQAELQKAIQRAKKRTGSEISKAEAKIRELRAQGAKDGNPALETQKSFLKKLKAGGIRVQYTDYADEKGQMSESAKNAKNILGQFWANQRSKEEGGGYRIEDKYDFDMFKKKDEKTGTMRDMNMGELIMEGVLGKGKTVQQRLQAAYLLNPFRGKGDVDMVLGGKRTAAESWGLSSSKTLLGGMLGASGNPQAKQAKVVKSKPKTLPVKPPVKSTTVMQGQTGVTMYSKNDPRRKSAKTSTPRFGATCPKNGNQKRKILGIF
jgi:hypothetical protein